MTKPFADLDDGRSVRISARRQGGRGGGGSRTTEERTNAPGRVVTRTAYQKIHCASGWASQSLRRSDSQTGCRLIRLIATPHPPRNGSQCGGTITSGGHQQVLAVLVHVVSVREIPNRTDWLVVATPFEYRRARVFVGIFVGPVARHFPPGPPHRMGLAPAGCASTFAGPLASRDRSVCGTIFGSHLLPQGKFRPSVPCAASCHSHSCGNRLPAHAA